MIGFSLLLLLVTADCSLFIRPRPRANDDHDDNATTLDCKTTAALQPGAGHIMLLYICIHICYVNVFSIIQVPTTRVYMQSKMVVWCRKNYKSRTWFLYRRYYNTYVRIKPVFLCF